MAAPKFTIPLVIVLSLAALAFHLAGFVAPGWTVLEYGAVTYSAGLWYLVKCTATSCSTSSMMDPNTNYDISIKYTVMEDIVGLQTEASVALVLTILATITVLFFRKFPQHHVTIIFVIVILIVCHLISGAAATVACGTKGRHIISIQDFYDFKVPYSLILTGIGAILNFVAAIFLIIHLVHVVKTLRHESSHTPLYLKSQMHQPLTKKNSDRKQKKTKKEKTTDNDSVANSEPYAFENTLAVNGYEKNKRELEDDGYDQSAGPGKHRSRMPRLNEINHTKTPMKYHDNASLYSGYSQEDLPGNPRPRKPRHGRQSPARSIDVDHEDTTVDGHHSHSSTPRKSRSKSPRHDGRSKHGSTEELDNTRNDNLYKDYAHYDPSRKPQSKNPRYADQHDHGSSENVRHHDDNAVYNEYPRSDSPTKSQSRNPRYGDQYDQGSSDNINYHDNTTPYNEYTQNDRPKTSRSRSPRHGRNKHEPSSDMDYQQEDGAYDYKRAMDFLTSGSTDPRQDYNNPPSYTEMDYRGTDVNSGYSHSEKPKPKPRTKRLGQNSPAKTQDGYHGNADKPADLSVVDPGPVDGDTNWSPRPSSYYEKLELESDYSKHNDPASFSPVESCV